MTHPLHTRCPACTDERLTVIELVTPEKCVLINCNCGQSFAVHLRVSVAQCEVPVPRPVWDSSPLPVALPEPSVASPAT